MEEDIKNIIMEYIRQDSGKDIRYLPTSETSHRNLQGKFRKP
jgi:hypothetical protein